MSSGMGTSKARNCRDDRRRAHRYKLNWEVRLIAKERIAERELIATLLDLSSTGALIHLETMLRLAESVLVFVKLPFQNETWMSYSATVVRVTEDTKGAGVALRFQTSRPEFRNLSVAHLLLKPPASNHVN